MAYAIKTFETPEGPLTLAFDFVPPEPTMAQLEEFVLHTCGTCEFKGCCNYSVPTAGAICPHWAISCDAYWSATTEYYKALHEKHYG